MTDINLQGIAKTEQFDRIRKALDSGGFTFDTLSIDDKFHVLDTVFSNMSGQFIKAQGEIKTLQNDIAKLTNLIGDKL